MGNVLKETGVIDWHKQAIEAETEVTRLRTVLLKHIVHLRLELNLDMLDTCERTIAAALRACAEAYAAQRASTNIGKQ